MIKGLLLLMLDVCDDLGLANFGLRKCLIEHKI